MVESLISGLVGFVLGLLAEWLLKDRCLSRLRHFQRQWRRRNAQAILHPHQTVRLGERDTYVCIIDGDGVTPFKPGNIVCKFTPEQVDIPAEIQADIAAISRREEAKKERGEPSAWNGQAAHVQAFSIDREPNNEDVKLILTLQITNYYHLLATSYAIHDEFRRCGFKSPLRQRLVGDFCAWRQMPPPRIANGLPVNLLVLTDDRQLVFAQRSPHLAVAANMISPAVNENIHPQFDSCASGHRLDVERWIKRALTEEIGWYDSENNDGDILRAEVNILAFGIHTGTVNFTLFGYVKVPVTFDELSRRFQLECKDRLETIHLIPIPFTPERVCNYIHERGLYDVPGVAAVLALLAEGISASCIHQQFERVQANTSLAS